MKYNLQHIPVLMVFLIVLSGLLIYFIFFLVDKYYIAFAKRKKDYSIIQRSLPRIKLFIWFVWFVISVYFLLISSPIVTLVFLIGIYLFSRGFWENIYSGIYFLFDEKIKEGDYIFITSLDIGGSINRLLLTDVELIKDNNEFVYVPYSLVVKSPIVKSEKSANYYLNTFIIEKRDGISENTIKHAIVNCPWTILSKDFEININNDNSFEVKSYTYTKDTARYQQEYVSNKLKHNSPK